MIYSDFGGLEGVNSFLKLNLMETFMKFLSSFSHFGPFWFLVVLASRTVFTIPPTRGNGTGLFEYEIGH
jgi:hypothetical protein